MALDFSLQDVNERSFRLSDFRGKVVALEFMSACQIADSFTERDQAGEMARRT
jgi:peroxiredoxin